MYGEAEKRHDGDEEEGGGEGESSRTEVATVLPNQTDGGSAESDTGYASMGDSVASEQQQQQQQQNTLTRTR